MRFSFLINSLAGGGTEKVCKMIASELSEKGYFVDLYVLDNYKKEQITARNVTVHYLGPRNTLQSVLLFISLVDSIKTSSILIFNHELALSFLLAKKLKRNKIKIITRMNNTFSVTIKFKRITYRIIVNLLMKLFYKYMDFYIFQSKGIELDLVNNYGVKGPSVLIPNPISIILNQPIKKFNSCNLLYVGRLVKQKNVLDILYVFNEMYIDNKLLTLTIVGDGPERGILELYCKDNNLLEPVNFIGQVSDTSSYYRKADVLLLTSFNEGFPNVLLESISYKTPVVSYDCPSGPSEIIRNNINGYLVKHLDRNELKINTVKALTTKWNEVNLIESINRFKTSEVVEQYELVLKKYEN